MSMIRIGTRGSPLALAQAEILKNNLVQVHQLPEEQFEIVSIKTTGDVITEGKLIEFGGKGLFTKEIEEALLASRIDVAVHSMKDVAVKVPEGLLFAATLPRADPRDAWVCSIADSILDLPSGAKVGTSSLRRGAQILHLRPDLRIETFRGSVNTRIEKINRGDVDATLLAFAGLQRIHLESVAASVIEVEQILPAVAQGALGIQCREGDQDIIELLNPLNDSTTSLCIRAERAFLEYLDGSCRTPIAALATISGNTLTLDGLMAEPDGSKLVRELIEGRPEDAFELGFALGRTVKKAMHS